MLKKLHPTATLSELEAVEQIAARSDVELAMDLATRILPNLMPSVERLLIADAIRRLMDRP